MTAGRIIALATAVFGVVLFLFSIIVLGTPILDMGMLSTSMIFVLMGLAGLAVVKNQEAQS